MSFAIGLFSFLVLSALIVAMRSRRSKPSTPMGSAMRWWLWTAYWMVPFHSMLSPANAFFHGEVLLAFLLSPFMYLMLLMLPIAILDHIRSHGTGSIALASNSIMILTPMVMAIAGGSFTRWKNGRTA